MSGEEDWDQWLADDPEGLESYLLPEPELPDFVEGDDSSYVEYWEDFGEAAARTGQPRQRVLALGNAPAGPAPQDVFVYHLTSIAALRSIVEGGKIECRNHLQDRETIGDRELSKRRHLVSVPTLSGRPRTLDNYVSFYFASFTPMLFRLVKNPYEWTPPVEELVILRAPLTAFVDARPIVFTDGHSMCPQPPAHAYTLLSHLGAVDFDLIGSGSWKVDDPAETKERRRRYAAELLALYDVPFGLVDRCAVLTSEAADNARQAVGEHCAVVKPASLIAKLGLPT